MLDLPDDRLCQRWPGVAGGMLMHPRICTKYAV